MKKKILAVPLLVVSMMTLSACEGSIANAVGNVGSSSFPGGIEISTSDKDPGEFEGITLAGPDNIIFTTGDSFSIRAEGDADAIEQLRYKIKDGSLKVGRDGDGIWSSNSKSATVYISAPALAHAKLAGSGNMKVDQMTGDAAKLSIAGSGNINVAKIEAASLSANIAGSGEMTLAGSAANTKISIAGSGDISAKGLQSETAKISVAGSGDVAISSDGSVNATVLGSGDVRVHGDAKCKSKSSGSGDITCS